MAKRDWGPPIRNSTDVITIPPFMYIFKKKKKIPMNHGILISCCYCFPPLSFQVYHDASLNDGVGRDFHRRALLSKSDPRCFGPIQLR